MYKELKAATDHLVIELAADPKMLLPAQCKAVDEALIWRIVDLDAGWSFMVTTLEGLDGRISARMATASEMEEFDSGKWDQ